MSFPSALSVYWDLAKGLPSSGPYRCTGQKLMNLSLLLRPLSPPFSLRSLYFLGNQSLRGPTPLTFDFSLDVYFTSASGQKGIISTCATTSALYFTNTTARLYLGCLARQEHTACLKGGGSVGRVLDLQTEGHEFNPQNRKSWCDPVLVIPALGR